jgi:hypothetical protein
MSSEKIKIVSHLSRLHTLPHNGTLHTLIPGPNLIGVEVVEAYVKSAELRDLLFKGAIGGLEIVGTEEDGKLHPLDHETALRNLFPEGEIPSAVERATKAAAAVSSDAGQAIEPGTKPEDSETDNATGEPAPANS